MKLNSESNIIKKKNIKKIADFDIRKFPNASDIKQSSKNQQKK